MQVYEKYGIILTLGVYAANESGKYKKMKQKVEAIVKDHPTVVQVHGFYVDEEEKVISLDLVFLFEEKDAVAKMREIQRKIKKLYPGYKVYTVLDTDI